MRGRATAALAWALCAASIACSLAFVILEATSRRPGARTWFNAQEALGAVAFSLVGALIVLRRKDNAIGWLFLAIGVSDGISAVAGGLTDVSAFRSPAWQWGTWFNTWSWVPAWFFTITFLLLLYPDGHLPRGRPWRWVAWVAAVAIAEEGLVGMFDPTAGDTAGYHSPLPTLPWGLQGPGLLVALIAAIACLVALIQRFRRSSGEERLQMKWFAYAGVATIALIPARVANFHSPVLLALGLASIPILPIAVAIAILKYRLYEIDVVISKTVVFGALAAFIGIMYVAVVAGVGSLFGNTRSPALSIAATVLVALLFEPVRDRVRRFANRLVYGVRATPYEVMAGFARRIAGTLSVDEVLPGMAEAAARGVGASVARVRVSLPGGERSQIWPGGADEPAAFDRTLEVRYQGDPVGGIDVAKPANEPFTPAEERLLDDLSAQAGLALHNVRLTAELAHRAGELAVQARHLEESRARLVTARDQQRRRLEMEIREGPAHGLVGIRRRLEEAGRLAGEDPSTSGELLARLGEEANVTLEALRDLARGIFPPLLVDKGIVAALQAHIRKVGANATIQAKPAFAETRFDPEVEACVYFCCLQAIQNVMRHAGNARTVVRLEVEAERVVFEIRDDGRGFDTEATESGMGLQIMRDRVDALDGSLAIDSDSAGGTTLTGTVSAGPIDGIGALTATAMHPRSPVAGS